MKWLSIAVIAMVACLAGMSGIQVHESPKSDIDTEMERASVLFEQGHTADSKKIYAGLLATLRNRSSSSQLGFVLNGLSKIAAAEGDYKQAIEYAKQSADVYQQVGDSSGQSHSLNNEGIAELQLGQYAPAQRSLQRALALAESARDPENEAQVLNNLGSSFYFQGSYSEAQHRYDEAMHVVGQHQDAKWSDYWRQITSFNHATLFQRLGRYEAALQIYRQVERSSKSLTPSDLAHLYANLGALYRRLGDPYKALDTYRAAEKLYAEQHDAGGELTVLKNIGIVYALDLEDFRHAREIFTSAIALAQKSKNRREEMQARLYLGETLLRAEEVTASRAQFEGSLAISKELGTSEERWKSVFGLGKVEEASGNVSVAESHYREAVDIIEKTRSQLQLNALRSDFFADKREAYDALINLLLKKHDASEAFLFLEKSRSRNFQDRILSADLGSSSSLTLELARQRLAPDTALLEFWTSGDRIGLIWCTRQNSGLSVTELSSAQSALIRELLDAVPNALAGNWKDKFKAFRALLPEDVRALDGVHHLLIVPDGWISYVPFDLVPTAEGSTSLLIERYDITYLPTAALLLRSARAKRHFWAPWTRELAAFGNPVVDPQKVSEISEDPEHATRALQFSAREIHDLAALAHGRKRLFLGSDDRKSKFLSSAVDNALILHVSTHAFADGDNPENSRLLFSPEGADGDPDYVFLRELYELNLRNVRLATISACDTERGKMIRGEGVQAFSRALLSAGAAASITTLWRVDDEATSEFMQQFYYMALHEHRPTAEALRLTKLKFLQSDSKLSNPQLWASFVLNGDGATPLPSVWSWGEMALLLIAVMCAVAGLLVTVKLRRGRRIERHNRAGAVVR